MVGGGNTAAEEAIFLTNFASEVKLIHRRDSLRAEKILQKRLMENKKIEIIWDTEIIEIIGDEDPLSVNQVVLKNKKTNSIENLKADGVFVAIGHSPSSLIFKNQLDMNDAGYIFTAADSTKTNINGVFAAGDVTDDKYRQAVTAAGMGCMAALEVEEYLSE